MSAVAVFLFGFVFGVLRIFVLIPRIGALYAVLVELPFMLTLSHFTWTWTLRRYRVPSEVTSRLITGLLGFAILMGLEYALSAMIAETGPRQFIIAIANPAGVLGLIGQFVFGLMPVLIAGDGRP